LTTRLGHKKAASGKETPLQATHRVCEKKRLQ